MKNIAKSVANVIMIGTGVSSIVNIFLDYYFITEVGLGYLTIAAHTTARKIYIFCNMPFMAMSGAIPCRQ